MLVNGQSLSFQKFVHEGDGKYEVWFVNFLYDIYFGAHQLTNLVFTSQQQEDMTLILF